MIEGSMVLMKKNMMDSDDLGASVHDGGHEFGQDISPQLISSVHSDPKSSEYDEKKSSSSTAIKGQVIQADTTLEKGKGIFLLPEGMSKDVDWNVEKIIHLKDYDLSQLPDSPTCHHLVDLSLQVPRLTVIPPTFFEHMPVLEVLDLSNTNILSLPSSISSLSLLREFFLRDCSALIELPTEIRTLTKLKLFDIEGTEIMYIPKEMENLKDLECLRVSLSRYADYYIKTKSVGETIIPRMMISELKKLKELCISVSPEAEWWESEVEAIQHELCSLEYLETLKWYLPTNKVLRQFLQLERKHKPIYAYLSSFMLTIGQHAQLTSCLPRDLEKKFEKFKKCLKCKNDDGSMDNISKIMGSAEALFLHRHWTGVTLSDFNIKNLKYFLLVECNEMQTLGETVGLESLQYLSIHYMNKLQSLWKGPIGEDSLSRLRILALHTCPELTTIFTSSIVINLFSLVELIVEDCPKIKSLISMESTNEQAPEAGTDEIHLKFGPTFTSLKRIFLLDLPELVNIGPSIFPELDSMLIYYCPKLSCLSMEELPHIKEIKGETEWWNALNCDKSKWNNIFVQLEEKKKLVVQLVEATNSLQHFHDIMKISPWPAAAAVIQAKKVQRELEQTIVSSKDMDEIYGALVEAMKMLTVEMDDHQDTVPRHSKVKQISDDVELLKSRYPKERKRSRLFSFRKRSRFTERMRETAVEVLKVLPLMEE